MRHTQVSWAARSKTTNEGPTAMSDATDQQPDVITVGAPPEDGVQPHLSQASPTARHHQQVRQRRVRARRIQQLGRRR